MNIDALWRQLVEIPRRFDPARIDFDVRFQDKESLAAHYLNPASFSGRQPCSEPWLSSTMRANGDILIRSRCIPYVVGNIREQTFDKIWRGEKYRSFRRILKRQDFSRSAPAAAAHFELLD